ncbi:hypothetical protein AGABI1DRAFT_113299 [Agaricus bisporus var. burnettii JB137-S8]|uniref:PUB domain-containing protein n=2 Tax=Agaricus bisporus var. burnettii TaxID=192524 RepID=K5XXS2_AGABU|nr:uncharacterized protein AGABI1DRAFT_113299 [Agaricus bisporus var. burnettii JB137-S8]EKM80075.1 hypothetical protein AGABI1DRAFT_113299 [Agaricus bisporus var. burnettii JB137-S8]KAF7775952.1 hypothetical protein Agabi119p4_4345 [Agaricus bisporus var. burnettii]
MSYEGSLPDQGHEEVSSTVSVDAVAAAALLRASQSPAQKSAAQLAAEHDRRQTFRRMIDPGIVRPNSKEQASSSLKTLLRIADNLLREPENPKFQQIKPTNPVIQRELMNPKGAIEYAIEMGFRPEVKDFQPYYTFYPRHMDDLRLGAIILREHVNLETEKAERAARAKANEKANAAAAAEKVKLAFIDDRKTKEMKDEIERQQRLARRNGGHGK